MERPLVDLVELVARRTSGARTPRGALLAAVSELCRWLEWPLGHAYMVDGEDEPLPPSCLWHGDTERFRALVEMTARTPLARGVGLPGRVLQSGRPAAIPELAADANLPRRAAALESGLRSAFAIPVEGDGRPIAVLECFSDVADAPSEPVLEVCAHIGRQLGRLIAAMHVEEALRTSERRFRSFTESATDALITADGSGCVITWNPAAERMFGYAEAEIAGRSLALLMPARFRAAHEAGLARVAEHGAAVSRVIGGTVEVVGLRKDGGEFPIELSLGMWESPDGRFFSGIIRDISGRKDAESRARALDGAPDPILKVDEKRIIRLANARAEALFGSGLEGRPVAQLIAPRSRLRMIRHLEARSREPLEIVARRGDGREFEAELTLSDDDGMVTSVVRDISERKRYERRLALVADHDGLTGLLNRRCFEERLAGSGAVVLLGLDNFKRINDTHGHGAGDELLRAVAAALRGSIRPGDELARVGGDEFAVLAEHAGRDEAVALAGRLVAAVAEQGITASAGVVELAGRDRPLIAADLALHAAKEAGGNRVHLTHGEDRQVAGMQARLARAEQIRRALAEDRFSLHWQPIVELASGVATQHELLLRMIDDDGSLLAPGAFIEAAERFGLIAEVDRWVIGRALRLLAERPDVRLEVNVSGASVGDPEIPALVEREIAALGVDPSRLIFEITETAAIADMTLAREFADRLTRLGCRFALDDFGAGFSSFHYLKHLPLDYLKIDGDFIRGLADSRTDRLVVKAMVDIARGLGMKTIAEFVEDEQTVGLLRELGVDYSQGYFHGRPGPIAALAVC